MLVQIIAFGREVSLTTSFSESLKCQIWHHKLETSIYRVVHTAFRHIEHLGVNRQCDRQTDGQNYDSNSVRLTTRARAI